MIVKDTLQSGISYVASSSSCDLDVDGDILTFSLGNLSSGENKICTYSVLIDEIFTVKFYLRMIWKMVMIIGLVFLKKDLFGN